LAHAHAHGEEGDELALGAVVESRGAAAVDFGGGEGAGEEVFERIAVEFVGRG
jgi:hypothetical protein